MDGPIFGNVVPSIDWKSQNCVVIRCVSGLPLEILDGTPRKKYNMCVLEIAALLGVYGAPNVWIKDDIRCSDVPWSHYIPVG